MGGGKGTRDLVGCGKSAGDSAVRWRAYTSPMIKTSKGAVGTFIPMNIGIKGTMLLFAKALKDTIEGHKCVVT